MDGMKTLQATVVRHTGSHYFLSELPQWNPFPAVMRGKVRLGKSASTNPVAVGDRVECLVGETVSEESPALITKILPRSNYLIRKSTNLSREAHVLASNVDMAFVIVTLAFPEVKLPFLDRLLVTCEVYKVPVTIVLNKVDLYRDEDPGNVERFIEIYNGAGYEVIQTSVRTGEGIDRLREICSSGVNLISGESGVGKSSLIKALDPSLDPRTGKISQAHLQGRHTTSLYEMYRMQGVGFIIDSPGLRGFGLVDLEKEEIAKCFPEMLRVADNCRFVPCTHTHEPQCAVKAALEDGTVSAERYNSYLGMLEEDRKFR